MASAELRLIRRRVRSVKSTMKITRAMELIAASRIVTAQQRVVAAQPYTDKMNEVIRNVAAASGGASHALLEARDVTTAGVLAVTSDRGLAGAYNSSILRLAEARLIELKKAGVDTRVYAVGKKARAYFDFRGYRIEQAFIGITDTPGYGDARAVANVLMNDYAEGKVDSIEVFTTKYVSALTQTPMQWQMLPIEPPDAVVTEGDDPSGPVGYTYEPNAGDILSRLLPRYVEASAFGLLLDASASEHAARRRAMKAATENAEELVRLLSREANQARQAEITTEISEIVGGAEALTNG